MCVNCEYFEYEPLNMNDILPIMSKTDAFPIVCSFSRSSLQFVKTARKTKNCNLYAILLVLSFENKNFMAQDYRNSLSKRTF